MVKALTSLKASVNDPTKAGLPDPNQAPPIEPIGQKRPATTTASQVNPKVAKAKTGVETYAEAIIGESKSSTPPILSQRLPKSQQRTPVGPLEPLSHLKERRNQRQRIKEAILRLELPLLPSRMLQNGMIHPSLLIQPWNI